MAKKKNGFANFTPDEAKVAMKAENHSGSKSKMTTAQEVQRTPDEK